MRSSDRKFEVGKLSPTSLLTSTHCKYPVPSLRRMKARVFPWVRMRSTHPNTFALCPLIFSRFLIRSLVASGRLLSSARTMVLDSSSLRAVSSASASALEVEAWLAFSAFLSSPARDFLFFFSEAPEMGSQRTSLPSTRISASYCSTEGR